MTVPAEIEVLPALAAERGMSAPQWRTLMNVLYPGAAPESVAMVVDYCHARKLDPFKKPVHIVPMQVKDVKMGRYEWRDCVLPGIYEYRITAQRTGEYLGHSKPALGPKITYCGQEVPEYCDLTVYRWNPNAATRVEFPITVYFGEACVLTKDGELNHRWKKAPVQMLTKCAEAAALRAAFPEELGGEPTAEEMEARVVDVTPAPTPSLPKVEEPKPEGYDGWLADLRAVADEGTARLAATWRESPIALRQHLTRNDLAVWQSLKAHAEAVVTT